MKIEFNCQVVYKKFWSDIFELDKTGGSLFSWNSQYDRKKYFR